MYHIHFNDLLNDDVYMKPTYSRAITYSPLFLNNYFRMLKTIFYLTLTVLLQNMKFLIFR